MGDGLIGGGTANFLELELSMATHPESIAVFLTDVHAKFTYPDGRSEDIAGNARDSTTHGRLHPPAGEYKQNGIRGDPSRAEELGFDDSRIGSGRALLSLLILGIDTDDSKVNAPRIRLKHNT